MTVLPVRSTCCAPAMAATSPRLPTRVNWPFSTINTEFSIGAFPSPVISRAPSNTVTRAGTTWLFICEEHAQRNAQAKKTSRFLMGWLRSHDLNRDTFGILHMKTPIEIVVGFQALLCQRSRDG